MWPEFEFRPVRLHRDLNYLAIQPELKYVATLELNICKESFQT